MKSARRLCRPILLLLLLLTTMLPVSAANLSVEEFELITRGSINDVNNHFQLTSSGNFALGISGGNKFSGELGLSLSSRDLEQSVYNQDLYPAFHHAHATMKQLFGAPVDLTYFTGRGDHFCSGQEFPLLFGAVPIMTDFRGFFYFPDGVLYDGIYEVNGTGLKLSSRFKENLLALNLYGYQDNAYLTPGTYSSDIRFLLNTNPFKMELTAGGSWPVGAYGAYRGGILLYISTSEQGAFLAQVGLPEWNPQYALSQDMFFFLIEPRIHFGIFSIIPTLFRHPAYYNHASTGEAGSTDINFNFKLGDLNKQGITGGLESFFNIASPQQGTSLTNQFTVKLSPYTSFVQSGSVWTVKLNFQLFPYSLPTLFELFVGIKAEF